MKRKHMEVEDYFLQYFETYKNKDIMYLKMEKEVLIIRKKQLEDGLKNRNSFKDYVVILTLFSAIYKVWDMEKEFYSLPFISSPNLTLGLITALLSILFALDCSNVQQKTKYIQTIEIMISSINYCLDNNLYSDTSDTDNNPEDGVEYHIEAEQEESE